MSKNTRYPAADPQRRQQQQSGINDSSGGFPATSSSFVSAGSSNFVVPTAPYPPMNNYDGMQSAPTKSSLTSSPHYTTTYGRASTPSSLVGKQVTIAPESGLLVDGAGTTIGGSISTTTSTNDGGFTSSSKRFNKSNNSGASNLTTDSSNNTSNSSLGVVHPSQIMFCPGRHDIVASINCISSSSKNETESNRHPVYRGGNSSSNNSISGKLAGPAIPNTNGPIMLQLKRLEVDIKNCDSKSDDDDDGDGEGNENEKEDRMDSEASFFTTRTVAVSRGNPNLGVTSVASTCMDLPSESIVKNYERNRSLVAVTGSSTGALCIHRFNTTDVIGGDSQESVISASPIEYFHMPRHHRKASSVAWRPAFHTNHVAIGLVGANATASGNMNNPNQHHHQLHRLRSAGSDREYCCFLWDINDNKKTMPLSKFAYNSPVASLAWMMEGQTLAIGGQQRTIQLYDLRVSTSNNNKLPPLSAHAHELGVHGIEVNPHRPHLMATFCRSVGEPVKLFDIRRMDKVVSEIRFVNSDGHNTSSSTASFSTKRMQQAKAEAIQWSLFEPGMLSVAYGESVQEYDTNSGSRPSLVRMNRVSKAGKFIKAFALYRGKKGVESSNDVVPSDDTFSSNHAGSTAEEEKYVGNNNVNDAKNNDKSDRLLSLLYPRRLLAVLEDQTIEDMAKDMNAPLAISRRDGRLIHALGPHLFVGASSEGPSAMERMIKKDETGKARGKEDISATMMRRARCLQTNPYSMNPEQNIKLMSQEVASEDIYHQWNKSPNSMVPRYSNRALLTLWGWIERVESLSFQDVDDTDEDPRMVRDILSAGALQLLTFRKDDGNDTMGNEQVMYSEIVACNVYDSVARRAALSSCGWAGKFDLTIVMAECEALGDYERSAALAVWHEDVGAAVEALQRASEAIHLQTREGANRPLSSASPKYAETLGLISMCIAGFGGKTESQRSVWTRACASLLERDDMSSTRAKSSTRIAYLRVLCEFLMYAGTVESLLRVLENTTLSLCDRVAFACRFLEKKELIIYLLKCVDICQNQGDLEGLAITGLSKPGIRILQSFVDHYTDVQTAAIVVSRVILPVDWALERKICFEWVESYRSLLNVWQMWESRASFDVDRADVLRRVKARNGGYQRRLPNPRVRQSPRPPDPDILPRIPAQLEARCNYCNSPLSLKRQEGITNQWLSKMQPLLNCCPQCRKPLPRCSVCLLSMGSLNPYMELTRARQGPRGIGKNLSSPDDLSSLSSMNFGEWYTWCMRCRHGGHAHHIIGWFSSQKVCPVSGCDCECEFDSAIKLNRPAICMKAND